MNKNPLSDKQTRWIVLLCLILIAVMIAMPVSASFAEPDFGEIDAFVETQMRELRIPGLALAIVQHDQIVYLQGEARAGKQAELEDVRLQPVVDRARERVAAGALGFRHRPRAYNRPLQSFAGIREAS